MRSAASNASFRIATKEGSVPFNAIAGKPNAATVAAMLEAEKISGDPTAERYSDVEEALRALKS